MKVFTYNLSLLDPVLVNQIGGGDPNSATGFDYIPGSVIRGAFIGKYLKNGLIDAMDETFRNLFFNSKVCFLNAYPEYESQRSLPVPFSWRIEKDGTEVVYDHAIKVPEDEGKEKRVFISVSYPFCCLNEDEDGPTKFLTLKPPKNIRIHTTRGERTRMGSEESSIFRYESLDKGQTLSGVILVEDEDLGDEIDGLLNNGDILHLGKSHLVGYGRARVSNFHLEEAWTEYTEDEDEIENEDGETLVVVTLLSDAIVKENYSGKFLNDISPLVDSKCINSFVSMALRGSFNRTWNLPTPQMHVIQAGSVFVYKYSDDLKVKLD